MHKWESVGLASSVLLSQIVTSLEESTVKPLPLPVNATLNWREYCWWDFKSLQGLKPQYTGMINNEPPCRRNPLDKLTTKALENLLYLWHSLIHVWHSRYTFTWNISWPSQHAMLLPVWSKWRGANLVAPCGAMLSFHRLSGSSRHFYKAQFWAMSSRKEHVVTGICSWELSTVLQTPYLVGFLALPSGCFWLWAVWQTITGTNCRPLTTEC